MAKLSHFPTKEIQTNTRLYNIYHDEYLMEDGWHPGNKQANYQYMMHLPELTGVPISGSSCLDVGCGSGDLAAFLRERGARKYVGIDIYERSLEKAREKYPDERFILGDLLTGDVKGRFDYAFCSGAMTVRLSIDNYDFLESMVEKMWQMTKVGIVFNVLTDEDPDRDEDLFFYNIPRVIEICKNIAPEANIKYIRTPNVYQIHVYMWR